DKSARLATEALAVYFRREFGYDALQFAANDIPDPRDRVYLLSVERYPGWLGVGAFCFRWREYTNIPPTLAASWFWLHPFIRRCGVLSSLWGGFRELYGDFVCERPLSKSMENFLQKRGECLRCGRRRDCERCTGQVQ